jgi:O-antigen/teichoic acid export membrane protein
VADPKALRSQLDRIIGLHAGKRGRFVPRPPHLMADASASKCGRATIILIRVSSKPAGPQGTPKALSDSTSALPMDLGKAVPSGEGSVVRGALSLQGRVFRGGAWSMVVWVSSMALALPLTVVLVRVMPRPEYGALALATTAALLLAAVADLGLRAAVVQLLGSSRGTSTTSPDSIVAVGRRVALYGTLLVTGVGVIAAALMFVTNTMRPALVPFLLLSPAFVSAPIRSYLFGVLQAAYSIRCIGWATVVAPLTTAVLLVLIIPLRSVSASEVSIARTIGWLASMVVLCACGKHWLRRVRGRPPSYPLGTFARLAGAMLVGGLVWTLIQQMDVFILGVERGTEATAIYAPISSLGNAVFGFTTIVATYLLPALAEARSQGRFADVKALYHNLSRWGIGLGAPLIAAMVIVPADVLRLMFGPAYEPYGGMLAILGVGIGSSVILGFNGMAVQSLGLPGIIAKTALVAIITSAISCPVLVAVLGIAGAALSTTLTISAINLQYSLVLARRFGIPPWNKPLALQVALCAFASMAAWLLSIHVRGAWPATLLVCGVVGIVAAASTLAFHARETGGVAPV